ncbi:MAG TPA: Crp/Fnr family transcriptional regulator [Vicinamibacterales bacterium]|nr:Crp/Fnr family transcriptional regulator [Vicinamibacterales bacterium]
MSRPMIADEVWQQHGATLVPLARGATLFEQGAAAGHFYQVQRGKVKMVSATEQGREFVQGLFADGQSLGEPPFFTETAYPASAIAVEESTVWCCRRAEFLRLLAGNPDIHLRLTRVLSERLIYKSMMLAEIAVEEAEHRLTTLIEYFRATGAARLPGPYRVPFTRQQLADMTGLRVETVVRTVKAMEQKGLLRIEEGKVIWNVEGKR